MRRECRGRFPRHRLKRKPLVSDPGMHHGTCVTHVPWCMSGSLTRGGRGKRSQHYRRMRNPQFNVSGKRPMKPYDMGSACELVVTSNSHWQPSNVTRTQTRNTFWDCIMQWHGNNFRVTGPSSWEATGHRWSPSLASDVKLWCFHIF